MLHLSGETSCEESIMVIQPPKDRLLSHLFLPIPEPWPVPQGLSQRLIDKTTGKLASQWCPQLNQTLELFLPGTEPTEYCETEDARRFRIPGRN